MVSLRIVPHPLQRVKHFSQGYERETISCKDKYQLWKKMRLRKQMQEKLDERTQIDLLKSILFSYVSEDGSDKYVVVCLPGKERVEKQELRAELGLSRREAESLDHKLSSEKVLEVTGHVCGAVSPLVDVPVYFSRSIHESIRAQIQTWYDIPTTRKESAFVHAQDLPLLAKDYTLGRTPTSPFFEIDIREWRVKEGKEDPKLMFVGSEVVYKGQHYKIMTPRKGGYCVAMPLSEGVVEQGARVLLPISYERLERIFKGF